MGRVPEDVEESRKIPVLGDLVLSLNAQEPAQGRIAADFPEASVIRGVPQQRSHQGDAPEDGDRKIIAAAAPRVPQPL